MSSNFKLPKVNRKKFKNLMLLFKIFRGQANNQIDFNKSVTIKSLTLIFLDDRLLGQVHVEAGMYRLFS
jgi:hypothetical protein